MENIVCFSLPSFFRLFSKENPVFRCLLTISTQEIAEKESRIYSSFDDVWTWPPRYYMLQLSNETIFLGLKGPNWLKSFEAQAIFLEIHFTREEYFDLSSFEKGTVVFFVSVSIFSDKVERCFFLIDSIRCLNCYQGILLMFYKHVPCCIINQSFSSCNENDRRCF